MHVVVVGQPGLATKEDVFKALDEAPFSDRIHTIVSIDMNGANVFSELWAKERGGIEIRRVASDKPVKRNTILATHTDALISWWDNKNAEVNDLMARFQAAEKPMIVIQCI